MKEGIKRLDELWIEFCKKEREIITCQRCGKKVKSLDHNQHYWRKHFFWMLGRRIGIC